jgi:ABC-type multidrug transport system fused ATPase/permease subunit
MNVSSVWDRLDRDLVIQEAMYGCIMALTIMLTAYAGIMHYSDRMHLIYAILGMDVVWAVIDMYIFYRADLMSLYRSVRLYREVQDNQDREANKAALESEFNGTVFQMISKKDQDRMIDVFLDGEFTGREGFRKSNRHYLFNAVTTFVFAAAPAIPPVLCLTFIDSFEWAILNACVISCILIFLVGYFMAPGDGPRSRLITGITTAGISLFFTVVCAVFGG